MIALITGADGFIGSHLTESLVKAGYDVRAFVCYNSFNSYGWLDTVSNEIKNKIEFFPGDIRDPNGIREAMNGIDIVFHLAAQTHPPTSFKDPIGTWEANVMGSINLITCLQDQQPDCHFIFCSTAS